MGDPPRMNPYAGALNDAVIPLLEAGRTEEAKHLLKLAIQSAPTRLIFSISSATASSRLGNTSKLLSR